MAKKKTISKAEQWRLLLEQIEDIKKMNKDYDGFVVIDGKNYDFEAFTEMVIAVVKEEKENEK